MESSPRACLTRREFVRRAAMGAVAAAAAGRIWAWPPLARAAAIGDSRLPTLVVDKPVAAIAAAGDRLVAVGGEAGDPRVWSLTPGAEAWELEATTSQFPPGVGLRSVARSGEGVVAVGSSEEGSGPRPAIFRSSDARRWELEDAALGSLPGTFTAVAERDGRLLAVGSRFAEPHVGEPVETIAVTAAAGDPWSATNLDGVTGTQHGAATSLASVREGLLLAVTDVSGLALYLAVGAQGPWRGVTLPRGLEPPASIVAAGPAGARTVLAALDALDRGRLWLGGFRGWREVQVPPSLPASARVMSLTDRTGTLVAAGEGSGSSFVDEVMVA